jgi:hypothetical protein
MTDSIRAALERLLAVIKPKYTDPDEIVAVVRAIGAARAALAAAPPAPAPHEALAARPLLEQVAHLADRIGQHTVGEITVISDRAAAWLAENPPGQPVAIEPRGCPTPGACSCVEPPAPDPEPSDFQTFQGLALDMIESLRPIVIPEILGVLRKAIKSTGQPAPAADGEREELAQWLENLGDDYDDLYRSSRALVVPRLTRAAALLRQPAPAPEPVPVSERPWEREEWCDAEGRCWFGAPVAGAGEAHWTLIEPLVRLKRETFSLPHWAIPLPQPPQGEEVAE